MLPAVSQNFLGLSGGNMKNTSLVRAVGAGVLVGAVAVAGPITSSVGAGPAQAGLTTHTAHASAGLRAAPMVHVGPTGNKLEMVAPHRSRYVPRILRASVRHRTKARRLLGGVNRFCATHSLADLKGSWPTGHSNPANPTHYFNPIREDSGINPARPKAALVYDGKVSGVMFTGRPLPFLGSIPRAHGHDHMSMGSPEGVEMVHVYCTSDLTVKSMREAYTPNRQLGVLADTRRLRLRIRPAVMDLNRRELRKVRAKVRDYVGTPSDHTAHVRTSRRGPDPALRAMRVEIRASLMHMNEAQLRSVWRLMRSF